MLSEAAVMMKTRDTPGPGPISAPTSAGTPTLPHCRVGLIAASTIVLELPAPTKVMFWPTTSAEPEVKVYTPAGMFIVSSAPAAAIASRSEQSEPQVPSLVSPVLVTVKGAVCPVSGAGVGVGVGVAVGAGVGVGVDPGGGVDVGVGVGSGVAVGMGVAVGTGVGTGTGTAIGTGVKVGTGVGAGYGVYVGLGVAVGYGAYVGVGGRRAK